MKIFIIIVVTLLILVVISKILQSRSLALHGTPGVGMRLLALSTSVETLGFTSDDDFPHVYGFLCDWYWFGGFISILVMRDGTASLYTDGTFGVIGGHAHEPVRNAAIQYVKLAEKHYSLGQPVSEFPYPEKRQVNFYFLTYDGVLLYVANSKDTKNKSEPAGQLFDAAMQVMTEIRTSSGKTKPLN